MSRRTTVLAAVIAVVALVVVVVITVVFAGTGTDDFHRGSVADLRKALHAKGLTICSPPALPRRARRTGPPRRGALRRASG